MELNNENPPVADDQAPVLPGNNVQELDPPPINDIRPTDPIMGIFVEQHPPGSGKWNARMGGKPNSEWTGLQSDQVFKATPFHYRRSEMTSDSKGFLIRSTGLSSKFNMTDDVLQLQQHVWKHLTSHGLDTITYLQDPTAPSSVIDVIRNHAKFSANLKTTKVSADLFASSFDEFDQSNDAAAQAFLLDSLDPKLVQSLERRVKGDDGFVMMWLRLIQLLVAPSLDRWDIIKDKIKAASPKDYAGQNIRSLCDRYEDWGSTLRSGGQYDHSLTRIMIKNVLKSKDLPAPYTLKLSMLQNQVDDALAESTYMSPSERWDHMEEKELTFEDVCDVMGSAYDVLAINNEWPAAKLPSDSAAIPSNFANLSRHLLTLLQNKSPAGDKKKKKSDIICYKCGEKGHYANRCPSKAKLSETKTAKKEKSWKLIPPSEGEASVKRVGENTFNWCAKCKRWTTTHSTATHTGKSKSESRSPEASASLLEFDPSVWCMSFDDHSEVETREMNKRVKVLADVIPVRLDPAGDLLDHLSTLEHKVYERVYKGPFNERIERLEDDLGTLDDFAYLGLIEDHDENGKRKAIFPVELESKKPKNDNPTSGWYKNFQQLYLLFAFIVVLNPLQSLMWEMCQGFGSLFLGVTKHVWFNWNSIYLPLIPPMSWMIAGYFACSLSRPQPVSTIELVSTYIPRQQRRNTLGMRRKKRKELRSNGHEEIDISGLGDYIRQQNRTTFKQKPRNKFKGNKRFRKRSRISQAARRKNQEYIARLKNDCHKEYLDYNARRSSRELYNNHLVNMIGPKDITGLSKHMALKAALHAPQRFRESMGKSDMFPIIWDSGASICVTFDKNDFLSLDRSKSHKPMKSISGKHAVEGEGHVLWSIPDDTGVLRHFKLKALWVPESQVRLLSTEGLLQQYKDETILLQSGELHLSGATCDRRRNSLTVRIHPSTNLPTSVAYRYNGCETVASALNNVISVVSSENMNLTDPEKELLRWHQRLGHISFKRVQALFRSGVLSHTEATRRLHTAASKIIHPPKCAACQFGKQACRPAKGNKSVAVRDRSGVLRQNNLLPGQCVSVDHFICSTKGRLFNSFGKTSALERLYCGGCLFVDHASGFVHVEHQTSLTSHDTMLAKEQFELFCRDHGVLPQKYMSDNATAFTSKSFTEHLKIHRQVISFAGAGAHHHNGHAERSIRTIMSIARTMMLHSAIHWPDLADATLWPMAVTHAVFLWNHIPDLTTGMSPSDLFTKSRWPQQRFHDLHVWGCPVYSLNKTISDGKKIPKWQPRSTRMKYMGLSPKHASSVPLVLNPATGSMTAQFHVVFDDWFATVSAKIDQFPDLNSDEWVKMFGDSAYQYPLDDNELAQLQSASANADQDHADAIAASNADQHRLQQPSFVKPLEAPHPLLPDSSNQRERVPSDVKLDPSSSVPSSSVSPLDAKVAPVSSPMVSSPSRPSVSVSPIEREASTSKELATSSVVPSTSTSVVPATKPSIVAIPVPTVSSPRRSTRTRRAPNRLSPTALGQFVASFDTVPSQVYSSLYNDNGLPAPLEFLSHNCIHVEDVNGNSNEIAIFKASNSDPDTLSFDEAMRDDDKDEWRKAALKEIMALEEKGTWIEVDIQDVPSQETILPGTWVFRRKRTPDGTIKKFKGRYCVRGDLQVGDFETFAPVVAFSTVRLFLILSLKFNWCTCSIDFANAFVQAELKDPVWIHLPRGFRTTQTTKTCLQLKKSLYGLSVAPRLWNLHLFEAIKSLGFIQSKIDPCLMMKADIFLVFFCDDAGVAAKSESVIDKLVRDLVEQGFELTREESFSEFLGIKYEELQDGAIVMTQKGLVDKIIAATDMENCNPKHTPALKAALGMDPDGEPMKDTWSYLSIVGMLLYLSTNTRPDITFAVSQVARYSHNPRESHANAVKHIVRYLAKTRDKGIIVKPSVLLTLDCYADADFAGLYGRDPSTESTSVKSRTGYIIKLGGCPVFWKSQLQTSIALSTAESEYVALSQSLRVLLPMQELLLEIIKHVNVPTAFRSIESTVRATVFEDNNSALRLATTHRVTNRTRYYAVNWHWFWDHARSGKFKIVAVGTSDQDADYLTKGLVRELFESNRKSNQGW